MALERRFVLKSEPCSSGNGKILISCTGSLSETFHGKEYLQVSNQMYIQNHIDSNRASLELQLQTEDKLNSLFEFIKGLDIRTLRRVVISE